MSRSDSVNADASFSSGRASSDSRSRRTVSVWTVAHQCFKGRPLSGRGERKSVGTTQRDCLCPPTIRVGDQVHWCEIYRGQMIGAVGAGKPVDVGHLPRSCHGDAEMVKHCSTADDCFAAGAVGGVKDAVSIEVEWHCVAVNLPTPRLAVMQGRSSARQSHGTLDDVEIHQGVTHE